jgi:large subunit ribosomal protein L10
MAKLKAQKERDLEELTGKLKEAKSVVFTDYRGTTVKDLDTFRKTLNKENVFSKVYKITLVRKAMELNGIAAGSVEYKTPVILSLSTEDETTPARIIKNMTKELKTISILEGIVDSKVISKAQVVALADLPSKDQLRAQFVGTINAPISGFVNVLAANIRGLINVLNAVAVR